MTSDPVRTIAESRFFDVCWYKSTYPDVALSGMDPVQHFLHLGAPMGRDPGPDFSTDHYLARHADVREAGHNPLWHYELFGRDEAREIAPSALSRAAIDPEILCSQIDRRRPCLPSQEARANLRAIFAMTLTRRPHRYMTEFDTKPACDVVDALSSLPEEELKARRILASVIMPSHNRADKISAAIRSVLEQSHHNLELIVVDDGSTDSTPNILDGFGDDRRLRVIRSDHSGVSAARNLGLQAARGEVIFYLDSDNLWTCDFLRLMLIALTVSDAQCAYSALRVQNGSGQILGYRGEPFSRFFCLRGNYVDLNVFCHRRALYEQYGGFDTGLRRMVDWDLVLRYTQNACPVFCPFIGCLYTDDANDSLRVSTSQPYLFAKIVNLKNTYGYDSVPEVLAHLSLSVAIKLHNSADAVPLANSLADAFRALGHQARIDRPAHWTMRHSHDDDLVILAADNLDYTPHPEQLTTVWQIDRALTDERALRNWSAREATRITEWVHAQLVPV